MITFEMSNDKKDLFRAVLSFEVPQQSLEVSIPCVELINKVAQTLPYDGTTEDEREWNIEWIYSNISSITIKTQDDNGWNIYSPFVSVNYIADADVFIVRYNETTLKTKEQLLTELQGDEG